VHTKEAMSEEFSEDLFGVPEGEVWVSKGEVVLVPAAARGAAIVEALFAVLVVHTPLFVCKIDAMVRSALQKLSSEKPQKALKIGGGEYASEPPQAF
jgi:hypothetical protein